MTTPRTIFVAGATGATGQRFMAMAATKGVATVAHVRPQSAGKVTYPKLAAFELTDRDQLVDALKACTTVVQLIGTMRKRFASGDTYETSDIGTTRLLVEAAKASGTVDHLVLLSSVGAGSPRGAYLKAKAQAEALVRDSGLAYTIFRPSGFEDREGQSMGGVRAVTRFFGLQRFEPITLDELASGLLNVALQRAPLNVALEGASLWAEVTVGPYAQARAR